MCLKQELFPFKWKILGAGLLLKSSVRCLGGILSFVNTQRR